MLFALEDGKLQRYLSNYFSSSDLEIKTFGHLKSPWQKLVRNSGDIIIVSETFIPPSIESSIAMLTGLPENPTVILLHNSESSEKHAKLVASGADVVLYTGIQDLSIAEAIYSVVEARKNLNKNSPTDKYENIKGKKKPRIADFFSYNDKMQMFMEEVNHIITSNTPLLILGETGVGKEHLAKAIHYESTRAGGPFVPVNIAGLPEQLLESELFGHEQGAFTGAIRYRKGAFELAHGGTIFLDEIGEMPLHLQAKLLRVLQDYEFRPIGSEQSVWVDVRVIAATNRNIEEEVNKGNFRKDLYYRLNVMALTIPSLRERVEDIPVLTQNFIDYYQTKYSKNVYNISELAMKALCKYDWPGNIRELMNVIERAIILCKTEEISLNELPKNFSENTPTLDKIFDERQSEKLWEGKTLPEVCDEILSQVERLYLQNILNKTKGKVGEAARLAGIHPRGFFNKMKKLKLKKEDYKNSSAQNPFDQNQK